MADVNAEPTIIADISNSKENMLPCRICLTEIAKYTCPRCNISYCSLPCYKTEKHSGCSEAFYKECVMDELSKMTNDSDDKKKVLEMLTQDLEDRAEDDIEQSGEEDLADRLQGLDLDRDISTVWQRLTPKEKEDFARMLQDGRLAKLIEIWTPWWKCKENLKLVREHDSTKSSNRQMPSILADIPDINILLKSTPSADLKFDLINILFAYSYVARIHNGSHEECPVDSVQDLFQTCYVLREQAGCHSVGEAIQKGLDDILQQSKKSESSLHQFNLTILADVKVLISGPSKKDSLTFVSAALSDLNLLLKATLIVVKKELRDKNAIRKDVGELKHLKSQVFHAEKKVIFLLSWLQRYGMGLHRTLPLLQFELETRQSELEEVAEIKTAVEEHMDKLKPKKESRDDLVADENAQNAPQKKIVELS